MRHRRPALDELVIKTLSAVEDDRKAKLVPEAA